MDLNLKCLGWQTVNWKYNWWIDVWFYMPHTYIIFARAGPDWPTQLSSTQLQLVSWGPRSGIIINYPSTHQPIHPTVHPTARKTLKLKMQASKASNQYCISYRKWFYDFWPAAPLVWSSWEPSYGPAQPQLVCFLVRIEFRLLPGLFNLPQFSNTK